ncbi:hypothetical protein SAMN03159391_02060 [Pseudomonas sp. NFACC37-1]|nr:hypothetical protein SAMN03159391_02060 [Pseudomonas sp. NFACC37-1]SFO27491.1 hypothetical protein SAMN03159304_02607 [Pseudomonas sp. NFACC24-1]
MSRTPIGWRRFRQVDALAAVIKATGSNHPVLVGWSLGGVVISNYLAAYGDADLGGVMYVDGVIELNAALISASTGRTEAIPCPERSLIFRA